MSASWRVRLTCWSVRLLITRSPGLLPPKLARTLPATCAARPAQLRLHSLADQARGGVDRHAGVSLPAAVWRASYIGALTGLGVNVPPVPRRSFLGLKGACSSPSARPGRRPALRPRPLSSSRLLRTAEVSGSAGSSRPRPQRALLPHPVESRRWMHARPVSGG